MEASREATWERIMVVQRKYNRLEETFANIPAERIGWWLRWRFERSVFVMNEVRGAHSHGSLVFESERRLPRLEHAAEAYAHKFAKLAASEGRGRHD